MPRLLSVLLVCAALAGCAQQLPYREGLALIEAGETQRGLAKLREAADKEPGRPQYRQAYFRQRDVAIQRYWAAAETARTQGDLAAAEENLRRILAIDPENRRALAGLEAARMTRRHQARLAEADALLKKGDVSAAEAIIRSVLAENAGSREAQQALRAIEERTIRAAIAGPQLPESVKESINLEFRDASIRQVFEAISKSTGLNFLFDRDIRSDLRITIFVRNSSIEDALRYILVTNQLEKKVLSENTILVYPNTAAKQREYQELVVKSFYLANADVKITANMIRTFVKTKDIFFDERLNLLVIRDTPDAVRMAERLVATQDLAEAEVMLDVEVLEVGSSDLRELGVRWPESVSFSLVGAAGTPGTVTLREWQNRSSDIVRLSVSNPLLAVNFKDELGRSNLLANPRIRVRNKEKARIHIGDKLPVITSTTTATGFVSESAAYLDVGLKLDVEPVVHLEDDVAIRIGLEVSNVVREIRSASGSLTYQVGTRNAATTLRLKDGETQILAGLISDEDRKTINQFPGLGDLPVLGRLFGSHKDTVNKTEIVLLITPRIIRAIARPELHLGEFPSGTEAAIGAPPLVLQRSSLRSAVEAAKPAPATATVPRVSLQAPSTVPAGEEFDLHISLDAAGALRSGLLDFAFDPSRLRFVRATPGSLVTAADKDAGFRVNAPEATGRLNLTFSAAADIKGSGELARIRFAVVGTAAGTPTIRLEAISLSGPAGQAMSPQLPPPVRLSLIR
jgi:general secretion pathway protein D